MPAVVTDLNETGLALQAPEPLPHLHNIPLRFVLPGTMQMIEGAGEMIWADDTGRAGILVYPLTPASRKQLNPRLNAYVEVCGEAALEAAKRAEDVIAHGNSCGPLHGVPVSIKGSIAVEGMLWETGTKLRRGMRASQDATLVARMRKAGAII